MMMVVLDTDPKQKGAGEHDEGDMAIPTKVAAYLVLIEAKIFGVFQIDLNRPACSDRQNHRVQAGAGRCQDQIIGLFARIVEATTDDEPVASIYGPMKNLRQDGPIKEPFAFGALTHGESLPVLGTQPLLLNARPFLTPQSLGRWNTHHVIAWA